MTIRAWFTTMRGRLLNRLIGGETLRQRLRDSEADCKRLAAEVEALQRRVDAAEAQVMQMRRRRTD